MAMMKRIMLRMTPNVYKRIKRTANQSDLSMNAWIIEELLKSCLPDGEEAALTEPKVDSEAELCPVCGNEKGDGSFGTCDGYCDENN